MTTKTLMVGGIPVEVTKKKIKHLYLRVHQPDGRVTLSAPLRCPGDQIRSFILKNMSKITAAVERIRAQSQKTFRAYVSGEIHNLWGKPYVLDVVKGGRRCRAQKVGDHILLSVPVDSTRETRERALNAWYRAELKHMLSTVVKSVEEKTGISANEYRIRDMKTRWGTCNIPERRIWINLQLAKKPPECLEYIVTHELVHLIEKKHTDRFYALVEKYCPAWKKAKRKLEALPPENSDTSES